MGNESIAYWEMWQKLVEAAANFQGLLPGSVLIGGSAAALHLKHRYSFDADHVLTELKDRYQEVLEFLEGRDDWANGQDTSAENDLGEFPGR